MGTRLFSPVCAASAYSGALINPAVAIGMAIAGTITLPMFFIAIAAELLGGILGAVLCWASYRQHFDAEEDPANKLGVFSTGPAIRSYGHNLITEIIATFVLVFVIFAFADYGDVEVGVPGGLGPLTALPVALLVVGIGASLGGPTGYAINPARDLGPRIAHAILPIKGKGSSDWAYSWVSGRRSPDRRRARSIRRSRTALTGVSRRTIQHTRNPRNSKEKNHG